MTAAGELGIEYRKRFGGEPKLDNLMSLALGRPVLDIYSLEDLLHEKWGDYEERGLSTRDLVLKEYGEDCLKFCEEAFAVENFEKF